MPPAKAFTQITAADLGDDDLRVRPVHHDNGKSSRFDFSEYMDLDEFLLVTNQCDSDYSLDNSQSATEEKKPSAELLASLLAGVRSGNTMLSESALPTMGDIRKNPMPVDAVSVSSDDEQEIHEARQGRKEVQCVTIGERRLVKRRKPRTYRYNPKPLQHKISRAFVPDDMKDDEYWERRRKNNLAAKKSREERRKKELEVLVKMDKLVSENEALKAKVKKLEERNEELERQFAEMQK